jgi:hypothetical protein
MSSLHDKPTETGPKKLLAIDGGGVRGEIAPEVLAKIENLLGRGDSRFRLAGYFDPIGHEHRRDQRRRPGGGRAVKPEHFTRFPPGG